MPRQSHTATVATLTDELKTTADLDENGLEPTPFDGFESPTNGTNGHVPEGVRPSEQCRAPSPVGFGCTFKIEHVGRHSWKPDEIADFGATNEDAKTAQPMLPGTPEPEQNDFTVPTESAFSGKVLMSAPGLQAIAERLIADDESLEHLLDADIRYCWRRRGGTEGGAPRYARIKRPSAWENFFARGGPVFLVDLSADHIRDAKFEPRQIEACLHEQLSRTEADPDDHDAYRILGYDFKGTIRTLDKFGNWKAELRELAAHVKPLPLLDAIESADSDDQTEVE